MPHPVGAWPFWEGAGNLARDYSGHGNHGTLIGGATWIDRGIDFDGGNDIVDIGKSSVLDITDTLCVAMKFYPHGDGHLISKRDGSNMAWNHFLENGYLYFGGDNSHKGTKTISLNQWYDVVFISDGPTGTIYINGTLFDSFNISNISSKPTIHGSIGARWNGYPTTGYEFNGIIDYTYIFDIAPTESQVKFISANPYFMYQIPEELYGYVAAAPPTGNPFWYYNMLRRRN